MPVEPSPQRRRTPNPEDASRMFGRLERLAGKWLRAFLCARGSKSASKESRPIESRSYTSSNSRSLGSRGRALRKCADAPSSSPAKTPSIPLRSPTAQTTSSRSNCYSHMLTRFSRARQDFPHFVRVDLPQVIPLQRRFDTIAMPLPEGNARFIAGCCFQQNPPTVRPPTEWWRKMQERSWDLL